MRGFDESNLTKKYVTTISAVELKQLLTHLSNQEGICFRFRLIGEMWVKNLMKVTKVTDNTVLLFDETENKYQLVKMNNIMQFEIDERFQIFQPHFHYDVIPSSEFE